MKSPSFIAVKKEPPNPMVLYLEHKPEPQKILKQALVMLIYSSKMTTY